MAILVQPKEIKAGHTFYVITSENTIERWQVIKKRGQKRYAMTVEGRPAHGELIGRVINSCSKFRSRRAALRTARLTGIVIKN